MASRPGWNSLCKNSPTVRLEYDTAGQLSEAGAHSDLRNTLPSGFIRSRSLIHTNSILNIPRFHESPPHLPHLFQFTPKTIKVGVDDGFRDPCILEFLPDSVD